MIDIIFIEPRHLGHNKGLTLYIFWISRAQFFRNSLGEASDSISAGTSSSAPVFFRNPRDLFE